VTTITDWSWVPNGQMGVAGFEKLYPNIHIDLTDVGAGSNEYTKLSTAIAASRPTRPSPGWSTSLSTVPTSTRAPSRAGSGSS
jgi:hypothetical protein